MMPKPEDFKPGDTIPAQYYDPDLHCHPAHKDGVWWALVRITARPGAPMSEVQSDIHESLVVDVADGYSDGTLQSVELLDSLYPDEGGPDGPVVYFP